MQNQIRKSEMAASRLTDKMQVRVRLDDGTIKNTVTRSEPWALGHGAMVILLEGISGGYDCCRVEPFQHTPIPLDVATPTPHPPTVKNVR